MPCLLHLYWVKQVLIMTFKNFIDANNEDVPNNLKTSVCIIGAGAAGITLANNLTEIDDVLLIESGDFEIDGRTQYNTPIN